MEPVDLRILAAKDRMHGYYTSSFKTHQRRYSMRVDEARKGWNLLAIKTKACTVVRRGKKRLLSDPRSELRLGKEKKKEKCNLEQCKV